MDKILRYVLLLIFLEIALLTYFFSSVSESSEPISNNRERDDMSVYIKVESNSTAKTVKNGIKNRNESTDLNHLKRGQTMISNIPNFLSRRNVNANMTNLYNSTNQQLSVLSNISSILGSKGGMELSDPNNNVIKINATKKQNITDGFETLLNETLNVPRKNQTLCTFSFDNESLLKARGQLSQSISLFYINLSINGLQRNTTNFWDELLHWQYVSKEEKFLVQLPVDFDILTYSLLIHNHDETVINIALVHNNSNCLEKDDPEKIRSIRFLLWNELFQNDNKHYLCNRNFTKQITRNFVYYLTTVWVGEDLNCTGMSLDNVLFYVTAEKDHLPLVIPVFCYILSLQFVWIFLLLDIIKTGNNKEAVVTESRKNLETNAVNKKKKCLFIELCPVFPQSWQKSSYRRNDKPYGLTRLVLKLLYSKCCCCNKCCLHNPNLRLLFLMLVFILLPFGIYRTVGKYFLLKKLHDSYLIAVRPSEPLFSLFPKDEEYLCLFADFCYATIFPCLYIIVGHYLYEIFVLKDEQQICCCFIKEEEEILSAKIDTISDKFTFRYSQFCQKVIKLFRLKNCYQDSKCYCKYCSPCSNCECCDDICLCLYSSISVPFPIFPFVCFPQKIKSKVCKCRKCLNFACLCVINAFLIMILYILCLRPIFSTFTFILRSFTHFFFVALPNRAAILRYTLLVFTTIAYFGRYIHQLIKMNAEILDNIFTLKDEERSQSEDTENSDALDEEMFDFIYDKLKFVKRRFYFLYIKITVVFMYLFITIETFITNTKALTGPNFQQILQFFLIIIGPYAVSLFLKANENNFLTDENKEEIKFAFNSFKLVDEKHQEPPETERDSKV